MHHLFYSFINLTIALFFLMLGGLCMVLPWSPLIRRDVVQLILEHSTAISLFGFGFFVVGFATVTQIAFSPRRCRYKIRGGSYSISVDESLLQDYVSTYWKNRFPSKTVPHQLRIKKNKIHLVADLPHIPHPQRKECIEKIKLELSELFHSLLGYQNTFYLSTSFQPEQKNHSS